MRRISAKSMGVGGVVALVVLAGVYLFVVRRAADPGVQGLAPVGDRPFGAGDALSGARRGLLNPDGTRLAVLTEDGIGIAQEGKIVSITQPGSNVVDIAWFGNGATLLVAEGPVPTGGLALIDIDGKVRGTIPLEPSVGFGSGYGMSVAPGGREAVVTAVERPALGAEVRRLVRVDLETGETTDLTPAGGPDEFGPHHLDKTRVAYTERAADGAILTAIVDLVKGTTEVTSTGVTLVGAVDGEVVVQDDQGRVFAARYPRRTLASIPPGASVTGIDASGSTVVVAETVNTPEGARAGRLRRLPLAPIRPDD